jgi:branched-subunit amino acid transport protein
MDQTYFASLMAVVLARAAERILLVLVGALAIYLGYSLFLRMPNAAKGKQDGEGKIELPGGISIFLTRVGPGIFFALFGIAVIGYSVTRPVNLDLPAAPGGLASAGIKYSGFAPDAAPAVTPLAAVAGPEADVVVARLNGLYQKEQSQMNTVEAAGLAQTIRSAKFAVMLGGWKSDWGDRAKFERWVRDQGDKDPPPDLVPGATVVFNSVLQ